MTRMSAVIPTVGACLKSLIDLLEVLQADQIPTVVYDNGAPVRLPGDVRPAYGMSLYAMWDQAVTTATTDYVAVLNDDITLLSGSLPLLAAALDTDPDLDLICPDYTRRTGNGLTPADVEYTTGTYRQDGVCGWCFVVRRATYPNVGDGYTWWYGDDELVARIQAADRRVGIYRGVPVDHIGEASAATRPWAQDAKTRDGMVFSGRWESSETPNAVE